MTKRLIILGLALVLILFLPIPIGTLDDGGTRIYASLTYKIVKWNRLTSVYVDGNIEKIDTYSKTSVYFFPDNFKSVDELWDIEHPKTYSYSGAFGVRSVKFSNIEVADYSSAMMLDLLNNGEWINDVLRHTFASYHLKHFKNLILLQAEMGHRDLNLLRSRYVNMQGITKDDAWIFFNLYKISL